MPKKPDTPERLLQGVIRALEADDIGSRHRLALLRLWDSGPLVCEPADAVERLNVGLVRAELLAYLRSAVQAAARAGHAGEGVSYGGIGVYHPHTYHARVQTDGRTTTVVHGEARDLVVLQLQALLRDVGLRQVRVCADPACGRLFVKTHRRIFCSVPCQARINKQTQRRNAREAAERARHLRHRRRQAAS